MVGTIISQMLTVIVFTKMRAHSSFKNDDYKGDDDETDDERSTLEDVSRAPKRLTFEDLC